jgi:hypothetical protein
MSLTVGDPFPSLRLPGVSNPNYVLDSAAGRYLLLAFLSDCDDEMIRAAVEQIGRRRILFDDEKLCFFGLLPDRDPWRGGVQDHLPGIRWLFDSQDARVLLDRAPGQRWVLLDPGMRVMAVAGDEDAACLVDGLGHLTDPDRHGGPASHAPVLIVPRLFEPSFCRVLIDHYDAKGGRPSGFMREIDGMTRLVHDTGHKQRSDVLLQDPALIQAARARIARRLAPEIIKAFQFKATRIERYLVSCYDAATGGYFRPHRDNTTKGTAHRRFAVSINLNQNFEGGDLRFPEYGRATFRPPVGGAVVFSCSLLHEATPVLSGRRYAFLPFLYDEAGAETRKRNMGSLVPHEAGAANTS